MIEEKEEGTENNVTMLTEDFFLARRPVQLTVGMNAVANLRVNEHRAGDKPANGEVRQD